MKKKTHAAAYGFGYDEWIGRSQWVLDNNWRYAFFQPFRRKKEGFIANEIRLFTIEPNGNPRGRLYIGLLRNCIKLSEEEAKKAYLEFKKRGWLKTMQQEVSRLCPKETISSNPIDIINVRFKAKDLQWFLNHKPAKSGDRVFVSDRYQLFS